MKLLDSVKDLVLEYIPPSAIPIEVNEDLGVQLVTWYVTNHALGRTTDTRNLEVLEMEEIESMCKRATQPLLYTLTDKSNPFRPHPGFRFQVREQDNFFATLACVIDQYEHMQSMSVVVTTTLKSGSSLKYHKFAGDERKQLVIEL
jgi:hypothetical protein